MNIKNYSLKAMCAALACTTVLSSMLAAYATDVIINETPMDDSAEINSINALADDSTGTDTGDSGWTTEENSFEDIKVTYQQSSSYAVTIPKTIALDTKKQAAYSVKVSGDIDANQRVYVAPVDGIADSENLDFYMSDLSGKKADVVATVTQNKTYWSSENVANAYEETQNCVSAPDLTAGTWEGTFQVEIRLETNAAQDEENPASGDIAPEGAYSHWDYTLDEENNTITLKHYSNDNREENVIVYANYNVNGKIYKTRLCDIASGIFGNNMQGYDTVIKTITFKEGIDTSNVINTEQMFQGLNELVSIDLGDFDTNNVNNMTNMFRNSAKLQVIYVTEGKWSTTLAESSMYTLYGKQQSGITNMFYNCGVSSVTYK